MQSQSIVLAIAFAFVGGLWLDSTAVEALECGANRFMTKGDLVYTQPGEYPHTARLAYIDENDIQVQLCSAAIVNQYQLITSRDCIMKKPPSSPLGAVVGDHSVSSQTDGTWIRVSSIAYTSSYSDMAILTLEKSLVFELSEEHSVNAACHPPQGIQTYPLGSKMYAHGWFEGSDLLKNIELELVDIQKCKIIGDMYIDDKLCLQFTKQFEKGLTGSPLVKYREDGRVELVGVASHELEDSNLVAFTRFDYYRNWLIPSA